MCVTLKILILAYKMCTAWCIYMPLYLLAKIYRKAFNEHKRMLRENGSKTDNGLFCQRITVFIGQKLIFNARPIFVSSHWTMTLRERKGKKMNIANIVEHARFFITIQKPFYLAKFFVFFSNHLMGYQHKYYTLYIKRTSYKNP